MLAIIGALAISLLFNNNGSLVNWELNVSYLNIYILLIALSFVGYHMLTNPRRISINTIDLCVTLFIVYTALNGFLKNDNLQYSLKFYGLLSAFAVYILFRSLTDMNTGIKYIFYGYACCGCLLTVYGFLQYFGMMRSFNPHFAITGPFHNPAPFSCHLTIAILISLVLLFNSYRQRGIKNVQFCILLLYILSKSFLLFVSGSRAAILAAFCGSLILLTNRPGIKLMFSFRKNVKIWLALGAILLIGLPLLYLIRPDSANGRLMIWRISLNLFLKHPLSGIGFDNFVPHYAAEQIAHFSSSAGSFYEKERADFITHPFNEPLLSLVENGLIGFGLFSFLTCIAVLKSITSSEMSKWSLLTIAILVALTIFGFFSYPSDYGCFNIIFFLCIAKLSSSLEDRLSIIPPNVIYKVSLVVLFLGGLIALLTTYGYNQAIRKWNKGYSQYHSDYNSFTLDNYDKLYSKLGKNGIFLFNYGILLSEKKEHLKAISVLEKAKYRFPHPELLLALGDSYKALGKFRESETAYLNSSYLVPKKLTPKYRLAVLYLDNGDSTKAKTLAESILKSSTKVQDRATVELIGETEILLYRLNNIKQ